MQAEDVINLYKLFQENEIEVWINGGWGIDALLGKQTREHNESLKVAEYLKGKNDGDRQRYEDYTKGFRTCTIKPLNRSDIYLAEKYIFYLGIYSDSAEPEHKKLSIQYDGMWVADPEVMRTNHLKVKLLD